MLVLTIDTSTWYSVADLVELEQGRSVWGRAMGAAAWASTTGLPPQGRHVEELAEKMKELFTPKDFSLEDPQERCCPPGECPNDRVPDQRELGAVVVGLGPGPYTGLRIGIATAAAYGDALGIPVYGVCSLDAIAFDVRRSYRTGPMPRNVLVVSDAKRREVYWACYQDGKRLGEPGVNKPADLPGLLGDFTPDVIAGATWLLNDTDLAQIGFHDRSTPDPNGLAALAEEAIFANEPPGPLVPMYLRPPDAKPPAAMKGISS